MTDFISIVWVITEKCDKECLICHRFFNNENNLSLEEQFELLKYLKEQGIKRICFSGGEPTIFKSSLFEAISYAHNLKLHTALTTHGLNLNKTDIIKLDKILDQILIPIRYLNSDNYESTNRIAGVFNRHIKYLLSWLMNSEIITEIVTVVTKHNLNSIIDIGEIVFNISPNIRWRIDEYYSNGYNKKLELDFQIADEQFGEVIQKVRSHFSDERNQLITFSSKLSRAKAPDLLITPQGNLVTTCNHESLPKGHYKSGIISSMQTRRDQDYYKGSIRNWDW
ncbi:MAG: radical SAM protein [Bacteroidales bacterium]|nr:radical SAM protein [Bacteroidales bacterium]